MASTLPLLLLGFALLLVSGFALLLLKERNAARAGEKTALAEKAEWEKKAALAEQQKTGLEKQMQDWQKQKEEILQATKLSVKEASNETYSKLLDDHRKQNEQARKTQDEAFKKITEPLVRQVAELETQWKTDRAQVTQVESVLKALASPAGVGQLAELWLENLLKKMGLEDGQDFITQYHSMTIEGKAYRPDAIIFLPKDGIIVVDSKASKFMLEIAQAQGTPEEEAVTAQFMKSMNDHLKALASKDYRSAVLQNLKELGRKTTISQMHLIMFLPTDFAMEKIRNADKDIFTRAENAGVVLAGPGILTAYCSIAKQLITEAKQIENQEKIIGVTRELMERMIIALGKSDSIGRSLSSALKAYGDFAGSVNSRLLASMKSLTKMGVTPAKGKALPTSLPTYDVHRSEEIVTLEADAEPISLPAPEEEVA